MIQVYTGDGKGKTTAALGQAMRAMGHGMSVYMVQFMKGRTYGELNLCRECLPEMVIQMSGRDDFVRKGDPEEVDLRMAREGWEKAREVISGGRFQMVILDEINIAIDYGLLPLQEVLDLLKEHSGDTEIICTGRYAPPELMELADLVSEVREIKHPYQQGEPMRKGIEY